VSEYCTWTADGICIGECGYDFDFNDDDGPIEAGWKFCPSCGLILRFRPNEEDLPPLKTPGDISTPSRPKCQECNGTGLVETFIDSFIPCPSCSKTKDRS